MKLDELELELRKLPGTRWVAFRELDDRLLVQLHTHEEGPYDLLAIEAMKIGERHCELPVAVDVVRWMTPSKTDRSPARPS